MFWRRKEKPPELPKVAVCCVDCATTRAMADALARQGLGQPLAILSDEPKNVLWFCRREKPALVLLEAMPDAMEKLDDPDKDISGRCELSSRITEVLPDCRVYLLCGEEFRHLEPVMQKAVETRLIHGYCFGGPARQQLERWLDGASGPTTQR